ncbi:hypothetical protein BGZ47_008859 [Haplosporangium gracile]|nr:hypothetical protein BGZ47_008859 [Haplosporangium gracile]
MKTLEHPVQTPLPPGIIRGNDVQSVLRQIASGLNQGYPDLWENLMKNLTTNGSSSIQTIAPSDLKSVMQIWGLDDDSFDKLHYDIQALIRLAVDEGVYIAQGLSYSWSRCQGHTLSPHVLSTLMVVVRVPYVVNDYVWRAEVGHVYVSSSAKTYICHPCMFGLCAPRCHNYAADPQLLLRIIAVMSVFQADWALNHLPEPPADVSLVRAGAPHCPSFECPPRVSQFYFLLQLIHANSFDNRDVYKTYRRGLLAAIQNATVPNRQVFRNMQPTVSQQGVVSLLENKLLSCFQKAGINESIADWWRRVHVEGQSDPISLECESIRQRKVSVQPPWTGCAASANVTVDVAYTWVLIAPRDSLFDILFIEGEVDATFEDCRPRDDDNQDDDDPFHTTRIPLDVQESGAIVRWAYVDFKDGSFRSVQYMAECSVYPAHVSKVLLDFLRFASASSYLRIPVDDKPLSPFQQY